MAAINLGTEDKKKLGVLGALLAVFAVGMVVFNPFGGRRSSTTTSATPTASVPSTKGPATLASSAGPGSGALAPNPLGSKPVSSTVTATTGGSTAQYIAFRQARQDPFVPHYIPALPKSRQPKPPPPPLPPLRLPRPSEYSGGSFSSGGGFQSLPPAGILASSGSSDGGVLANLPQVRIPQYTPRESPRMTSSAPFAGPGGGTESTSARLAGVVIGDSVRALVEVTTPGGQVVSRVVQPGDEIEGIRILRLERINEGGQSVTRMTVSQNGREQYFTLRPSTSPRNSGMGTGLGGIPGGFGGMPGGMIGGFPTTP
jgi:hypothetical protein